MKNSEACDIMFDVFVYTLANTDRQEKTTMAKVKIISNPYDQEITYLSFDEAAGAWKTSDEDNESGYLRAVENKKSFLPFRIKEIIDIIISEYGSAGEKVEIIFQGTNEEYREVEKVCADEEYAGKVELVRSELFLENARSILKDTKDLFRTVQPIIEKIVRDDNGVRGDLAKVSDALDDIVPICVFGNYSAGKSTFINALIGSELLPSGDDPVTAKVYEIKRSSHKDYARIQFLYHGNPIDLEFDGGVYRIIKGDPECDLLIKVKEGLALVQDQELPVVVNAALEIINAHEKEDGEEINISNLIQVEVPFSPTGILGQSQNNFVIFDTPGSNSASNKDHVEALKAALAGFSNGIPVWVANRDNLDSQDNENLCNLVQQIKALDGRFTMIVVNKADSARLPREGFSAREVKNIMEYSSVEKMYAAGIFFVSSIMGLGAKTKGVFKDEYLMQEYYMRQPAYETPGSPFYTTLYKYNIMPEQIKEEMSLLCTEHPALVYANSGLYCIEQEIEDFASKYSAYNKCQMVYLFLDSVIAETSRRIVSRTDTLKRTRANRQRELDAKKQELILTLAGVTAEREREFVRASKTYMQGYASEELRYTIDPDRLEALDEEIAQQHSTEAGFEVQESVYEKSKGMMWSHIKEHGQRLFSKDFKQAAAALKVDLTRDMAQVQVARDERDAARRGIDSRTSDDVLTEVVEQYKNNFLEAKQKLGVVTKRHWQDNVEELKNKLVAIVTDTDALSSSQREQLSSIIMDFQAPEFSDDADDVFIKTKFLRGSFFGLASDAERLNIRRLAARYNERIAKNIASMAQILNDSCYVSFKAWMSSLLSVIEQNITEYNPQLRDMAEMIREETEKIIELETDQTTISATLDAIKQLMAWKDVDFEEMHYGH